jgi:hypothetical protein
VFVPDCDICDSHYETYTSEWNEDDAKEQALKKLEAHMDANH